MRIRKRTPVRAASPGPAPVSAASTAPPPPQLQHPKVRPQEEEEEKASLVVGVREQDQVPAASKNRAMEVPKPDPEPGMPGAGVAARPVRCSRNDGKRWRCKGAAAPGYLFCDRHIAWSTRKRKPKANKKIRGGSILSLERTKEEAAEEDENEEDADAAEEDAKNRDEAPTTASNLRCNVDGDDDGFYYYGGFQPSSRKRAKGSGSAGPAA